MVKLWLNHVNLNKIVMSAFDQYRPVVPGGAMPRPPPPQILADQLHNPISTKESRLLCPQNNTGTFGFSDLPTVLQIMYIWCPSQGRRVSRFGESEGKF